MVEDIVSDSKVKERVAALICEIVDVAHRHKDDGTVIVIAMAAALGAKVSSAPDEIRDGVKKIALRSFNEAIDGAAEAGLFGVGELLP
jgi:hypothetical protein